MIRGRARQFSKKTSALGLAPIGYCRPVSQELACAWRRRGYGATRVMSQRSGTYEKSNIDLRHQTNEVQENAEVTAPDTEGGAIRQFVKGVAGKFPGASEADVCEADAAPDEEVGKTRQG
jgi:hypothetical protein